jgi:hypothetical protein
MNNLFEYIKSVYSKIKIESDIDDRLGVAVTKWLSYDIDNIKQIAEYSKYVFYSKIWYYYYYLSLPKKKQPYFFKIAKYDAELGENEELYVAIAKQLKWSRRELIINKKYIDDIIFTDIEFWRKELL